jgi:hypothetical protein
MQPKTKTDYPKTVAVGLALGLAVMLGLFLSAPYVEAQAARVVHLDARAVAYGSNPTAVAAAVVGAQPIMDREGMPYHNTGHPNAKHCYVATTATTATQVTGCEVAAGKSYYVTSVVVSGDIANATATPWQLTTGTSTACTGATVLLSGWHPALTTVPMRFNPPIKATAAHGLCILDGVTGSKSMSITGYLAP